MQKIGILGSGQVARVLANGFLKHGYEVVAGSREPQKLADWKAKSTGGATGTFEEAAAFGEIVVLAVKGTAAEALVKSLAPALKGKTVIDATNPLAEAPPVNGILSFFTAMNESLMERLQRLAPEANFVKAFSSVGSHFMVDPDFGGTRPSMFIAGNSATAKQTVASILDVFGWESVDVGGVEGARAIEPLCILWCAPGFLRSEWNHAFKLLKA